MAQNFKLQKDAYYKGCINDTYCNFICDADVNEVLSAHYTKIYTPTETESMTNEAWDAAREKANKIWEISMGSMESDEYYDLMRSFYIDLETDSIRELEEMLANWLELITA